MGTATVVYSSSSAKETSNSLIRQHSQLREYLLQLERVAAMQLNAESPQTWSTVLEQKQALLDEIETFDMDMLFKRTNQLITQMPANANEEDFDCLKMFANENLDLLSEVMKIEAAAEIRLHRQTEAIQLALAASQRRSQVTGIYSGRKSNETPRFINSVR